MLEKLGLHIVATGGTYQYFRDNGVDARYINKLYEGRPNILDSLMNGEISFVINTPAPESIQAQHDDSYIRKTAIRRRICYMTTLAAARAATVALHELENEPRQPIKSLQEYHADIR